MKGINYYHESMGFIKRTPKEVLIDLNRIRTKFEGIRVYHNPYNADNLADIYYITLKAKEAGLYVIWVENNDSQQLTEAGWGEYVDRVKADAPYARKSGADEFLVGNEISIHNDNSSGYDDITLPVKIKNLISDCKPLFDGKLGYQEGWWKKDAWNTAKLENVEKIYFTLYEAFGDFDSNLRDIWQKFGNRAGIGEWSTQSTLLDSASDERDWQQKLSARKTILDEIGIDHSYFCFRDTGIDNNDKGFGLWKYTVDQPHLAWNFF